MARRSHQDDDAFDSDDDWEDDSVSEEGDEAGETAFCPECGAEVHDTADICTKCFTWIDGASRHPPGKARLRARRNAIVAWVLIAAMLASAALFVVAAIF